MRERWIERFRAAAEFKARVQNDPTRIAFREAMRLRREEMARLRREAGWMAK